MDNLSLINIKIGVPITIKGKVTNSDGSVPDLSKKPLRIRIGKRSGLTDFTRVLDIIATGDAEGNFQAVLYSEDTAKLTPRHYFLELHVLEGQSKILEAYPNDSSAVVLATHTI